MKLAKLQIGNLQVNNNVFLAPMAGYTDLSFRSLQSELGAGLTFTELVSAKGVCYDAKNNASLLDAGDFYHCTVAQIFGSDAYFMRKACESEYLKKYKIVDINMGCPVPKIFKNGDGSALLKDIRKSEEIIKECVKSGKIITVKIRTGLKKGDDIASEFAQMAESAGASLITIHGRVREDYYSGEPDFNAIEKAKSKVKIPVIANGGIFTELDAINMMDKTGADGIMLARGAIKDPFLIAKLTNTYNPYTLKEYVIEHVKRSVEIKGSERTAVEFRKFVNYYLNGIENIKERRLKLMACTTAEQTLEILETL